MIEEEILALKLSGPTSRKWDERFLNVAKLISSWSKDPSTKVGAIAVSSHRRILAQGYNGLPAGIDDDKFNMNDRISKYEMIIHAESNVIYNACNSGVSLKLTTIYIYGMFPCPECIKAMAQVNVARIVFRLGFSKNTGVWKTRFDLSREIMHDLGIGFTHYKEIEIQ